MNFRSDANSSCDSNSLQDPMEFQQKREKSGFDPRPAPSAMLEGMDIADRRI
jgi:hypothetical protein